VPSERRGPENILKYFSRRSTRGGRNSPWRTHHLGERRGKEWSKCKKGSGGEQEGDVGGEGRDTNQ
jgi:hypothetical protein